MSVEVGRCLVRSLLRQRGMTQQQLAEKIGMTKQQVSVYVTNEQQMSLKTARRFALALNCHIDDLYEWLPAKSSETRRKRASNKHENE